jgi:RND family efflux transporter MFP subunit
VATDPATVPVGDAKLNIRITDPAGKALDGLTVRAIAQMPGMAMGEHEAAATPVAGQPGVYAAPVRFAMEGGYEASITISGVSGASKAVIPLKTGQNTGTLGGGNAAPSSSLWASIGGWLPWIAVVLFLLFVIYRMRVTGQQVNVRRLFTVRTLLGVALIVVVYLVSSWAVKKYTQPGHMSVIEAQGMDMSIMKPPVGAVPVAAMAAKREPIEATVRYSGSVVPFQEQSVTARVAGSIVWMPAYPGNHVRRGQVVARLDISELKSKVGEQAANVNMAEHQTEISRRQADQAKNVARQADAQITEAQSDVAAARSDLSGARQDVAAAQDERTGAEADVESAQASATDAQAQLSAAKADRDYWTAQIKRSTALVSTGAISRQEFQQDQASAEGANAKVRQAEARVTQVNASIRSAQSRLKKAEAMIASAEAKTRAMQAKVDASQSKVTQARDAARALKDAAGAAQHQIAHSEAGVREAQARLNTSQVVAGYAELRADIDGVVTQRLLSPGQLVQPGQALLKISQISPIRLQANVAEADLASVRVGASVRVSSSKDGTGASVARVTSVFPAADPVARTGIVEAILDNTKERFLPGQYVSMEITTGGNRSAVVVPSSSVTWQAKATSDVLASAQSAAVWVIQEGRPEKTVYTCTMHPEVKSDTPGKCPVCGWELTPQAAGGKWRVHLVPVTIGLRSEKYTEIRSGVREGEQVIYAGIEGLHEGDPVVPTEWGPQGATKLPPATGDAAPGKIYTCLMHPEVKSDKPGKCPKCGMDLVPASKTGAAQ